MQSELADHELNALNDIMKIVERMRPSSALKVLLVIVRGLRRRIALLQGDQHGNA